MTPDDIVSEYISAFKDLYGKDISIMRYGSWYQIGPLKYSKYRLKQVKAMAAELRRRKGEADSWEQLIHDLLGDFR